MNEVVFFSNNRHKIKEVRKILKNSKFKILTLKDFPKIDVPEESGNTFNKNARIKSIFGFKKLNLPCFADDSGICINALNNQPGVRSKRFQKENGGFKKTFEIIINEAKRKNNYNAFFQTTIALTTEVDNTIFFNGVVHGKISKTPIGIQGFHYDPIFIPKGTNKTYAQMLIKEKNQVSHRAIAVNKLKKFIENYSTNIAFPLLI